MKFEEALKAMREGKRVKRPIQSVPKSMIGGKIFEVEEPKEHLSLKNINAIERKAHNLFGNEYVNKYIQVCLISYMLLED